MAEENNTVLLEGVKIIFRNFRGEGGPMNREGDRNFGVIIPDLATAEQMLRDGWNIKYLKPNQEELEEGKEVGPPWLPVKVKFGSFKPPKILMITSRGETALDDATVETLDHADMANVDLIIRPYRYDVNGKQGIAAYVKTMMVTLDEDELERKYAEMKAQEE